MGAKQARYSPNAFDSTKRGRKTSEGREKEKQKITQAYLQYFGKHKGVGGNIEDIHVKKIHII